jgi:excisionase family DNA binding protein
MNNEVLDINGLADFLGMSRSKVYAMAQEKKLPLAKIGRKYRFVKSEIMNWLKDGGTNAPTAKA